MQRFVLALSVSLFGMLTAAEAAPSEDLVFCSKLPDKDERIHCYSAAARIAETKVRKPSRANERVIDTANGARASVVTPAHDTMAATLPSFGWTGCYVGVHAGGGIVQTSFEAARNGGGGIAGGQFGCNYQIDRLVFGVETEGYWSFLEALSRSAAVFGGSASAANSRAANRWDVALAARIGFAASDNLLVYGKIGGVMGQFDFSSESWSIPGTVSAGGINTSSSTISYARENLFGALVGIGAEYALNENWSAKLEYNYISYLSRDVDFIFCSSLMVICPTGTANQSADKQLLKFGANYRWAMR